MTSRPARHRHVGAAEAGHDDDGVDRSATVSTAASAVSFIGTTLPRRVKPSAVTSATAPASCEADGDRFGAVAGEDRQEDRAELRDREQRGHGLRAPSAGTGRPRRRSRRRARAGPRAMRSVSVRSSDHVSVRTAPSSPSHTTAGVVRASRGSSAHSSRHVDREVAACRPSNHVAHGMPSRHVEHLAVRLREAHAEEADDRVPEPFGLVDRSTRRARRTSRCPCSAMKRATLLSRNELGRWLPPRKCRTGHRPRNLGRRPGSLHSDGPARTASRWCGSTSR